MLQLTVMDSWGRDNAWRFEWDLVWDSDILFMVMDNLHYEFRIRRLDSSGYVIEYYTE